MLGFGGVCCGCGCGCVEEAEVEGDAAAVVMVVETSEETSEVGSEVMPGVDGRSEREAVGSRCLMPRSSQEASTAASFWSRAGMFRKSRCKKGRRCGLWLFVTQGVVVVR